MRTNRPERRTTALCAGVLLAAAAAAAIGAGGLRAQAIALQTDTLERRRGDAPADVLDRRASLEVYAVPLTAALGRLAAAGAPLVYSADVLQGLGPVSCDCADARLGTVLRRITKGLAVRYRELETGQVLLTPAPRTPAPGVIRGRVIDADAGDPVVDATVSVLGTELRVLTREDGTYRIGNVPPGERVVRVTHIGYSSADRRVTVPDGGEVTANFELSVGPVALRPLNVTVRTGALIATERRKLGTAIEVIREEEIRASGATDLRELLTGGHVVGVTSLLNGGQNGAGGHIQIRGATSFLQDQTPLVYVDGVPVDAGSGGLNRRGLLAPARDGNLAAHTRIDELTLDQVERIEIVKGPAATTMYGTDAINGVIHIITKRGRPGRTRITAALEQGISTLDPISTAIDEAVYPDAIERLFRRARTQRFSGSVSGGVSDGLGYSVGASHVRNDGVAIGNAERRTSLRTSFDLHPRDDLDISISGSLVQRTYDTRAYRHLLHFADMGTSANATDFDFESIDQALELGNKTSTDVNRLYASVALSYEPTPIWRNQLTVGVDRSAEVNETIGRTDPEEGIVRDRVTRDFERTSVRLVSTLLYPQTTSVNSSLSAGFEAYRDDLDRFRMRGIGLPAPDVTDFDQAEELRGGSGRLPTDLSTRTVQVGAFVQERVGLGDRLFITGGLRLDGNSTFGDDFGLQLYPKLSAAYNFNPTPNWDAKLRAAWGQSGKAPPPFAKDRTYALQRDLEGRPILRLDNPGNRNLKPELGTEIEFGIENFFFGNRASAILTYFHQTTKDAILRGTIPLSTGFSTGPLTNVGELRSQGIELSGRIVPLEGDATRLAIGLTLTHMIDNGLVVSIGDAFDYLNSGNQGSSRPILQGIGEGESIRALAFGSPYTRESDAFGDYVSYGSRVPTTHGNLWLDLRFLTRLRLYTNFAYGIGGHGFDYIAASRDLQAGLTQLCCWYVPEVARSRYIYDTDHVRLDLVRLSYTPPPDLLGGFGSGIELWLEGRNVFSLDELPRGNPQVNNVFSSRGGATGALGYLVPQPLTLRAGIRMNL